MSLQHALLGFLNYRPATGYELKQTMDVSTSNFWHAKQSQIYTTLKKMEKQGLVISDIEVQESRPARRVYTITESGQAGLQTWLARPIIDLQPIKVLVLLKLFFSASRDKEAILTQLRLQRELHQRQSEWYEGDIVVVIQQFSAALPNAEQDALLWDATRRFGVMYENMIVAWLDETIAMIDAKF